ncbi:MAG: amidohydrolase [Lentisphaeria bacterium]|nr:amidohydrolase [Lentisphaeria bacterium]
MRICDFFVIDAHVHPFLDPKDCIGRFGTPATLEEMAQELKKTGFARACGSVIRRKKMETFQEIRELNETALKAEELFPDLFIPGVHVHGSFPGESASELKYLYEKRHVRWIGELVQHTLGTGAYDSPGMFQIYETAVELGLPVNIHCPDLGVVERVVKNFPRLSVVLAHPDDGNAFLERSALVGRYRNLYLDLSGTGLFRWGMLRNCIGRLGAEKLLFGTDFPVCSAAMNLFGVLAEDLSKEEYELIFAGNFLRLTGLKREKETGI